MPLPSDICVVEVDCSQQRIGYRTPMKFGGRVVEDVVLFNVNLTVETVDANAGCGVMDRTRIGAAMSPCTLPALATDDEFAGSGPGLRSRPGRDRMVAAWKKTQCPTDPAAAGPPEVESLMSASCDLFVEC